MKTFKIELNAMLEVPIWETHKRGTNWAAIIEKNPDSPGGIGRDFLTKAKGDYYYKVDKLSLNSPIEFGADYTSNGGKKYRKRWFGVVIKITEEELYIQEYLTARQAINNAKALTK